MGFRVLHLKSTGLFECEIFDAVRVLKINLGLNDFHKFLIITTHFSIAKSSRYFSSKLDSDTKERQEYHRHSFDKNHLKL